MTREERRKARLNKLKEENKELRALCKALVSRYESLWQSTENVREKAYQWNNFNRVQLNAIIKPRKD